MSRITRLDTPLASRARSLTTWLTSRGDGASRRDHMQPWAAVTCYIMLIVFSVVFLVPLAWSLSTSFKSNTQIYSAEMQWIPSPIEWANYPKAMNAIPFFTYLKNSVLVTVFCIVGVALSTPLWPMPSAASRGPDATCSSSSSWRR